MKKYLQREEGLEAIQLQFLQKAPLQRYEIIIRAQWRQVASPSVSTKLEKSGIWQKRLDERVAGVYTLKISSLTESISHQYDEQNLGNKDHTHTGMLTYY